MGYVLDFVSQNCGEHSGSNRGVALAPGEMFPPYEIKINGSLDLADCMKWNDGGCVHGIKIKNVVGGSYMIYVDAQGPSGITSGSGYLRFIDYSGDHYDLSVYLSHRRTHFLEYMSVRPGIQKIMWSNNSF